MPWCMFLGKHSGTLVESPPEMKLIVIKLNMKDAILVQVAPSWASTENYPGEVRRFYPKKGNYQEATRQQPTAAPPLHVW